MRALRIAALLLVSVVSAWADVPVPPLSRPVTDLTATLGAAEVQSLEADVLALERSRGAQVAVLILPTTAPEDIESYSMRVVEAWKLGRKGVDDGVLILVAKNDRAARIEVGYGLEGVIPDAAAKRVVSDVMIPYLARGDYYGGLKAAVARIGQLIAGEALPPPAVRRESRGAGQQGLFGLIVLGAVGGLVARALLGRLAGGTLAGVIVGVAAWVLFSSLAFALFAGVAAFVLTLFGNSGGPWLGGYGGGYGGGYRGGDGWSGGGGGFGGGGASGRW